MAAFETERTAAATTENKREQEWGFQKRDEVTYQYSNSEEINEGILVYINLSALNYPTLNFFFLVNDDPVLKEGEHETTFDLELRHQNYTHISNFLSQDACLKLGGKISDPQNEEQPCGIYFDLPSENLSEFLKLLRTEFPELPSNITDHMVRFISFISKQSSHTTPLLTSTDGKAAAEARIVAKADNVAQQVTEVVRPAGPGIVASP